jgi:hypothetical protein
MIPDFTKEERGVLDEFVFNVKKNINEYLVVVKAGDFKNRCFIIITMEKALHIYY